MNEKTKERLKEITDSIEQGIQNLTPCCKRPKSLTVNQWCSTQALSLTVVGGQRFYYYPNSIKQFPRKIRHL
jgi:hypothetical protein